ncbi:helix-turn-helix domain-containing protein [Fibrobacterota bacterium]
MREKKDQAALSRKRTEIILKVRSGEITATEGAKQLGISRKSYYQWEKRGLEGMMKSLEENPPGRPEMEVDPEKDQLMKENQVLKQELETAKKSAVVRKLFHAWEIQKAKDKKKTDSSKKKKR